MGDVKNDHLSLMCAAKVLLAEAMPNPEMNDEQACEWHRLRQDWFDVFTLWADGKDRDPEYVTDEDA